MVSGHVVTFGMVSRFDVEGADDRVSKAWWSSCSTLWEMSCPSLTDRVDATEIDALTLS